MDIELIPNKEQIDKFEKVLVCASDLVSRCGGRLGEVVFDSAYESAKVSVYLMIVDASEDDVLRFCDAMNVGTVEMSVTIDCEILLTITVPDVFIPEI